MIRISYQRAAVLLQHAGMTIQKFRQIGEFEVLLPTGAKLKPGLHTKQYWIIVGYAQDGSDIAPYRQCAIKPPA